MPVPPPALSLEQAYGAIAFYLAHQQMVDAYLQKGREDFERMREESRRKHPTLYVKLEAARRSMPSSRQFDVVAASLPRQMVRRLTDKAAATSNCTTTEKAAGLQVRPHTSILQALRGHCM